MRSSYVIIRKSFENFKSRLWRRPSRSRILCTVQCCVESASFRYSYIRFPVVSLDTHVLLCLTRSFKKINKFIIFVPARLIIDVATSNLKNEVATGYPAVGDSSPCFACFSFRRPFQAKQGGDKAFSPKRVRLIRNQKPSWFRNREIQCSISSRY